METSLLFIISSLLATTSIMAAFPDDVATTIGQGCQNTMEFNISFLTASGDACSTCNFCDGSRESDLFDSKMKNVCVDCETSDSDCDTLEVLTTFDKAWMTKYFHVVSSEMESDKDPAKITLLASNDEDEWTTMFSTDATTSSFMHRKTKKTFVVPNNKNYKHLSVKFVREKTSPRMYVGTYGIIQDYTQQCSTMLFDNIAGIDVSPTKTDVQTHDNENLWHEFVSIPAGNSRKNSAGSLTFSVNAKHDAHIALGSSKYAMVPGQRLIQDHYEIVLGGWGNTRSVIRKATLGADAVEASNISVLSYGLFREFRVTWDETTLKVERFINGQWKEFMAITRTLNMEMIDRAYVLTGYGSAGAWKLISFETN